MSDWLKWNKGLTRKREVIAIANHLKRSRYEIAAMCMEIWEWADDNTTDGNAPNVTEALLDELVGVTGFAAALKKFGWLHTTDAGIVFPKFDRHNGNSAKKRVLTKERVQLHRDKCNDSNVTKALPDKRREDNNPPIPPEGGGVGGNAAEQELRRCGVSARVSKELADNPRLTATLVRLAYRQAERDRANDPAALMVTWFREGGVPDLDISPQRICELVNSGDVVAVNGHPVSPGLIGHNGIGFYVYRDKSRDGVLALIPPQQITCEALTISGQPPRKRGKSA